MDEPKLRPYFKVGFEKLRDSPLAGPQIDSIEATTVHNIEEYLDLCKSIEKKAEKNSKVIYRGQTNEYLISGTRQISLLPSLAREDCRKVSPHSMRDIAHGYQEYLTEVLDQHINFISGSEMEAARLKRLMRFNWIPPEPDFLSRMPISRFLADLYSTLSNPLVFEACLQHYGFPTLNIDATYSPLVAMFFATHKFKKNEKGYLSSCPTWKEGSVYVMSVPNRYIQYTREKPDLDFHDGRVSFIGSNPVFFHSIPTIADLFDMTLDNDNRARRQYAVSLTEIGNVGLSDPPQLNACSFHINHIIHFSKHFWKTESTLHFLESNLGGWFFPASEVDLLFRKLLSKSGDDFILYDPGKRQYYSDPSCKFEFMSPIRIVLTGSDAHEVLRILGPTWHARMGTLEILPKSKVLQIAADPKEQEVLDIVIACERGMSEAERLHKKVINLGSSSGRSFVAFETGHYGEYRKPKALVAVNGGLTHLTSDDPYDSDFSLQERIFSAMLLINKTRYDRKMKPDSKNWKTFLKRGTSYNPPVKKKISFWKIIDCKIRKSWVSMGSG